MIFDEGEAARPQDVVIGALDLPVKVGPSELIVVDGAIADTVRGPGRQLTLLQVAREDLRGRWPRSCPRKGARKQGDLQEGAVQPPQKLSHDLCGEAHCVMRGVHANKLHSADKIDIGILEPLHEVHNADIKLIRTFLTQLLLRLS